ncbi:MAG: response regulator [Huintestinicola sp.]|uniref:response regulator n=1 Tax=Huintestinicola sp. TaxID=2981661 RepID=UPI003F0B218C
MRIIAVDDEEMALGILEKAIHEAEPSAEVAVFDKGAAALEFAVDNKCDAAFLDINMGAENGIALAKALKLEDPEINIIFSTGYDEYALEAIGMRASGYIMKPITAEKVRDELDNLRYRIPAATCGRLRIRCFGNFDVFSGEKPLEFKYSKSKELLAYLVDRNGSMCANNEIISVLWETEEDTNGKQTYFKSIRRDLISVLRNAGFGDVIVQHRGAMGIDKDKVECDYYDWQSGRAEGINAYRGEYMMQYSWSEFTHGLLK